MQAARRFESQLAESILEGNGQLAFEKLATATLKKLMPRIEGKGEFGQARWRVVYAPQIPSLVSVDPTADPLKSLTSNISFGTEVEVQLGKRLQVIILKNTSNKNFDSQRRMLLLISIDLWQFIHPYSDCQIRNFYAHKLIILLTSFKTLLTRLVINSPSVVVFEVLT